MDSVSRHKGLCKYCFDSQAVPSCYCLDCELFLCGPCLDAHNSSKVGHGHNLVDLLAAGEGNNNSNTRPSLRYCKQQHHENEVVKFLCKTCDCINICQRCYVMNHGEHKVVPINQSADNYIWDILTKKESVHGSASAFKHRVEQIEQAMVITEQKVSKERQKIHKKINTAVKALQKHQQEITSEIDKLYLSYARSSADEKRKLKLQLAQMGRALEQVEKVVTDKENPEAKGCASALLKRLDEVLKFKCGLNPIKALEIEYVYEKDIFQMPDGHIISYTTNPHLNATKTKTDQLPAQKNLVTNFKTAPPICTGPAEVNLTVPSLSLSRETDNGTETKSRRHSTSSSKPPELVRQSLVLDRRNSASCNTLLPKITHEIHPPVSCELIPKGAFGGTGKGKGEFRNPKGIALNSKGEIAIADSQNRRVQILTANGSFLRQIGRKGSGNGELQHPMSVAFDSSENIVVSDTVKSSVQMFTPEGKFVKKIGEKQIKSPYGVSVSSEGNIIVCDVSDHNVKVFSKNGELLLRQFGTAIELVPECSRYGPYFAVYHGEQYFVSYCGGNHCVKIFDKKGNYVRSVGKEGENAGELFCPRGVAVSSRDHILVCDSGNHRIQVFTLDGRFVGKYGTKGMGLGQFDKSGDLVISQGSRVYVTDGLNDRVEYFDY